MQVFDLVQLRFLSQGFGGENRLPVVFEPVATYDHFSTAHNIFINEETGFAYVVGTNNCDAGVHVVDIRQPIEPRFVTCMDRAIFETDPDPKRNPLPLEPVETESEDDPSKNFLAYFLNSLSFDISELLPATDDPGDAYTHDIQCVIYRGSDEEYRGREICVASNDDTVNVVDVTDKADIQQLSVIKYPGVGFAHQGWLTEDQSYFLLGDEYDEVKLHEKEEGSARTTTFIFDVRDLNEIKLISKYVHETEAIDHNLYVKGNYVYQANYMAGLRIFDLSEIASGNLTEVAFFDTFPEKDAIDFDGAWSNYPYYASGVVAVSNIDGRLFVLKPNLD